MTSQILILLILIILSGAFSGTEMALVSLSDVKVRNLVEKKKSGSVALARVKQNPQKLLITILIGNNLVNIGASALATLVITNLVGSAGVGIATGVMTFLILVFGEIVPKSFAQRKAEKIALFIARPIEILSFILSPAILLFDLITKVAMRYIGGGKPGPTVTEDELKTMAAMGVEAGTIRKKERELLESVFKFNDITAEDVMTPRVEMFCLDGKLKLKDTLKSIIRAPYSRIPIYKKNRDNIVGVLYIRDVLTHLAHNRRLGTQLKELAKKPYFVPKEKIIDELFRDFQKRNIHIAIVLDEYGGTEGLVTLEDLLEELVGEIIDESDISSEVIMRLDKNSILADGTTELRAIKRFFNIKLPGEDLEAVSELILRQLGHIPKKGEKISFDNIEIEVQDVTEKKINRVKITKL